MGRLDTIWNLLAERFDTHKARECFHQDAAVNIYVGWPTFFEQIEKQKDYLEKDKLRILDFGCGTGLFLKKLHSLGHEVQGIDHSDAMLKIARENLPEDVKVIHGNHRSNIFLKGGYTNYFDVVTAIHSLEWIKDIERALLNLMKTLNHKGIFLCAIFPKEHVIDSLRIKDLFEDFDSDTNPTQGIANFDGVRIPVYIRDTHFFDKIFLGNGFDKFLEYKPNYPREFLRKYKWTGSRYPEMLILGYRKN